MSSSREALPPETVEDDFVVFHGYGIFPSVLSSHPLPGEAPMPRNPTHPHSRVLLVCGLLLSACGVAHEDGATQEPPGTTEAAICSGLSVSSLGIITGASSYGGINAIRLEYYVDGVPRGYDQRPGDSEQLLLRPHHREGSRRPVADPVQGA